MKFRKVAFWPSRNFSAIVFSSGSSTLSEITTSPAFDSSWCIWTRCGNFSLHGTQKVPQTSTTTTFPFCEAITFKRPSSVVGSSLTSSAAMAGADIMRAVSRAMRMSGFPAVGERSYHSLRSPTAVGALSYPDARPDARAEPDPQLLDHRPHRSREVHPRRPVPAPDGHHLPAGVPGPAPGRHGPEIGRAHV